MPEAISQNLTELLRQREECFVTVWECEQKLREILPDFPIPLPPELPSRRQKAKGQAIPHAQKQNDNMLSTSKSIKLRELDGTKGENAYRLKFAYAGEIQESFQTENNLANSMANMDTDDFKLLEVETVSFVSMQQWTPCEVIWKNANAAQIEQLLTTTTRTEDNV